MSLSATLAEPLAPKQTISSLTEETEVDVTGLIDTLANRVGEHWPRPARLLPTPEPIETVALLPDHPPVSFTWRGVRRRVKCADGPERVFGEWWKRDAELIAVRDYFRVEGRCQCAR